MTKEEAEKEAQLLLTQAKKLLDRVTEIARKYDLDGLEFMRMTFHSTMERWGATRRLMEPDWFDNDYWQTSSPGCEVGIVYPEDEL